MKRFLYLQLIFSFTFIHSQSILWLKRLDLSQNENGWGVTSDSSENIIIAGPTQNLSRTSSDVLIVKYNTYGDTLWHKVHDVGGFDWAVDLTTDPIGNIVIAALIVETETPALIKFSPEGAVLWTKFFPGFGFSIIDGVALDSHNNIFACGSTSNYSFIIKCDTSGDTIWTRRYYNLGGGIPEFWEIVLDPDEKIIITGLLTYGPDSNALLVAKFNSNGDPIWTRDYTTGRWITLGTQIKLDNTGNIVVAGCDGDGHNSYDCLIFKYSPEGTMLWNRLLDFGAVNRPSGIAIDINNNIFISGGCGMVLDTSDYFLTKFSSSGETLWTRFYDGGFDDNSGGVVVDSQNNPIISGSSSNGANYDIVTIKYQGASGIKERPISVAESALGELKICPNPFQKLLTVEYSLHSYSLVEIGIFDITGKEITKIKEYQKQGIHKHFWDGRDKDGKILPSGVYFITAKAGQNFISDKVIKEKEER